MLWATGLHATAKAEVDALCRDSNEYMAELRGLAAKTLAADPMNEDVQPLIDMWAQRYAYLDDKDIQRLRNGTRSI